MGKNPALREICSVICPSSDRTRFVVIPPRTGRSTCGVQDEEGKDAKQGVMAVKQQRES